MTWFKVDDGYAEHPKTLEVSLAASGLWVRCGAWAAKYGTNGFIPQKTVWRNCEGESKNPKASAKKLVQELCESGFWDEVDGGFLIHDFLEYNFSKDDIRRKRAETRERVTAYRERKKRERNALQTHDTPDSCNTTPEPEPEPEPEPYIYTPKAPKKNSMGINDSYTTSFEQFWAVYPWQDSKPDAYAAFREAQVKTSAAIIIAAASNYAMQQRQPDAPYTMKPANWLRNEGWNNKPRPVSQPRRGGKNTAADRLQRHLDIARNLKAADAQQMQVGS